MKKTVLLVVDIQNLLMSEHPHNEVQFIENVQSLIEKGRTEGVEVIYVRHDDGPDTELAAGTEGWEIYGAVAPKPHEKIVDKQYNSAFYKTDLQEYLGNKGIETIMLVGMQTEFCIDATLRSAFDLNYKVLIPENTNTTYDNAFLTGDKLLAYYHQMIWDNRYAKVITLDEAKNWLKTEA